MRKVVGGGDKKNSHKGKQKSVQRGKKNTFKIAQKIPAQVDDQTPPPPPPPSHHLLAPIRVSIHFVVTMKSLISTYSKQECLVLHATQNRHFFFLKIRPTCIAGGDYYEICLKLIDSIIVLR
jgi:hypothetical protein